MASQYMAVPGKLPFTIRPSDTCEGKSISELRKLRFWVGMNNAGEFFSLDEIVVMAGGLLDAMDRAYAAKKMNPTANPNIELLLNLEPSEDQIHSVLKRLQFSAPGSGKTLEN
jgi:hypothetical protein